MRLIKGQHVRRIAAEDVFDSLIIPLSEVQNLNTSLVFELSQKLSVTLQNSLRNISKNFLPTHAYDLLLPEARVAHKSVFYLKC